MLRRRLYGAYIGVVLKMLAKQQIKLACKLEHFQG